MEKTALQELSEVLINSFPERKSLKELFDVFISKERRQIEASYKAGQNDPQNKEGSGKYYFMTYIDND
jgi:hypothetical protein